MGGRWRGVEKRRGRESLLECNVEGGRGESKSGKGKMVKERIGGSEKGGKGREEGRGERGKGGEESEEGRKGEEIRDDNVEGRARARSTGERGRGGRRKVRKGVKDKAAAEEER